MPYQKLKLPMSYRCDPNKRKLTYVIVPLILFGACFTSIAAEVHKEFPVSPPPMTEGMFPCSNCHASMELNQKKRELKDEHTNIRLHHAETMRWCLDCHETKNRDKLRLYNGELINFTESYRLCGECHGNVYRDWKAGIHGKRVGFFSGSGKRTYFLCAHCHDPHEPQFKRIKPEPPPLHPIGNAYGK